MPKQHFVGDNFLFCIIKVLGSLSNKLPFSFHFLSFSFLFSLAKQTLRMRSQRMSG